MTKRTVYVIGAGASAELGLPVGDQLKEHISDLLNMHFDRFNPVSSTGDTEIWQALKKHEHEHTNGKEIEKYYTACKEISSSMPLAQSIDNYIDSKREDEALNLCGKIAILKSILSAESNCKRLFIDPSNIYNKMDFWKLSDTWYLPFFRTIIENCDLSEVSERLENITLIVFNYDRCIEHFLINAFATYYSLPPEHAAELVKGINILHPYGTVGDLHGLNPHGQHLIHFGRALDWRWLTKFSSKLRTFTENPDDEVLVEMRYQLANAERLIFLGFAFHRMNMRLLSPGEGIQQYHNQKKIECYATAYKMSTSDQESVGAVIGALYYGDKSIEISDSSCSGLYQHYSRSLGYS